MADTLSEAALILILLAMCAMVFIQAVVRADLGLLLFAIGFAIMALLVVAVERNGA